MWRRGCHSAVCVCVCVKEHIDDSGFRSHCMLKRYSSSGHKSNFVTNYGWTVPVGAILHSRLAWISVTERLGKKIPLVPKLLVKPKHRENLGALVKLNFQCSVVELLDHEVFSLGNS